MVRSSHGAETEGILVDISLLGCCIRSEAVWLKMGSFVSVSLEEEPALQAIVRWVRNGAVGMELLHRIPSERTEWLKWLDSPFGGWDEAARNEKSGPDGPPFPDS